MDGAHEPRPELAAYIGRPVKPSVAPVRVEGYAGHLRADRIESAPPAPTEQETPMPTGVYPRKKKAAPKTTASEFTSVAPAPKPNLAHHGEKPAKGRKARAERKAKAMNGSPASGPRFGVFEDGTIELKLPGCSGTIAAEDARGLVGFLRRIGVEA